MKKKWIVVKNKKTYLLLLSIPAALIYIIIHAVHVFSQPNPVVMDFVSDTVLVLFLVLICVIFFIKFNTYSHWMNPNHPKSE